MPEIREDQKVKELLDEIGNRTRDLSEVIRVRVLQALISKLQERLGQRNQPDNTLPPEGQST